MRSWLSIVGLLACVGCRAAPVGPPNVVLISLDTVRADHLSTYGYHRPTSPNLDRLAAQGVRFDGAISQGNESLYGHAALLTGRYPSEVAEPDYQRFALPPTVQLLPEILQAHGYRTGAFTAGGHVIEPFGFNQGFDTFHTPGDTVFVSLRETVVPAMDWLDWIGDQEGDDPFFLFLHSYDAHYPYDQPEPFPHLFAGGMGSDLAESLVASPENLEMVRGRTWFQDRSPRDFAHAVGRPVLSVDGYADLSRPRPGERTIELSEKDVAHVQAHYDGALAYQDMVLGRFIDDLETRGLLEDTLLIVVADHGEDLLDHGFMNHRTGLTDSCTWVPLVISGPGFGQGLVEDGIVETRRVMDTVLAAAGAMPPAGHDLRPLRSPDTTGAEDGQFAFSEGVMDMVSVRTPTHRMIFSGLPLTTSGYADLLLASPLVGRGASGARFELFDLTKDPGERTNLLSRPSPQAVLVAKSLRLALYNWRSGLVLAPSSRKTPSLNPEQKNAFQKHGYW